MYPSILQYISVFTQIKIAKNEDLKDLKPNNKLGGGFKYLSFSLYLGKSPILTSIFFNWVVQPPPNEKLFFWIRQVNYARFLFGTVSLSLNLWLQAMILYYVNTYIVPLGFANYFHRWWQQKTQIFGFFSPRDLIGRRFCDFFPDLMITLPETKSSHLKMEDDRFLLVWLPGRCYVSFRKGNSNRRNCQFRGDNLEKLSLFRSFFSDFSFTGFCQKGYDIFSLNFSCFGTRKNSESNVEFFNF